MSKDVQFLAVSWLLVQIYACLKSRSKHATVRWPWLKTALLFCLGGSCTLGENYLEWVKEWWQVSQFVCNFCNYSPYYCSRWHQLAWNFDRYFLFQKLVPFSSLILTYSTRILKILNMKHNLLVKYPKNTSICGEYSQA